ncbi:hypothetical protein [Endozoicomonas sp. 4G]|uniref:WD40 repeat domain-containing protein n=1 Tax=Endozoicomonas sp. 4G TaxID=2872754 RepID=UPI00207882EC|nr:hypothetical protein [Endozoicomonas sp. 4G]
MNIGKGLTTASLIISLTVSGLEAQTQTTSSMQPTEIPPQLFYEIEIDPNLPPEIPASTPTASAPTHCPPHKALSVAWNRNSTLIAVGTGSGSGVKNCLFSGALQIFDMSEGYPRLIHVVHTADWVWSVTFSPDDTQLITGGDDETVNVFEGMSPFNHLQVLPEAKKDVRAVAINANGTLLAAGGYDTDVRLYLRNGTNLYNIVKVLTEATGWVEALDFNPVNGQLAVGEDRRKVRTYSGTEPYTRLKTLFHSAGQIYSVAYNPNGTLLTSADSVKKVRFYNGTNPGDPLLTLSLPSEISRMTFNPVGTQLAVGQEDGKVVVFEGTSPFSHLYTLMPGRSSSFTRSITNTLAYSRDGKWLVTGRGSIMMYRVDGLPLPTTQATTTHANTTEAGTEMHNASVPVVLSLVTLLTAALQGMVLQ